ncbi:hypothetical protein LTR10_013398 [Elasticomyces elasticus]|uniref:PNPLA domain-containing protein n=1 Tax=Exophiala sideris TaxID=1016849 RepID=A0ABR0J4V7_9EURO|nr:hypothetical protein LTR10_013398 [Elasticomyces elasticus]KAK5027372.1 hypothetical protein LTS07_006974 [Exophiala sideris]KAK5034926.1 hypothetical protein LTR13_006108 [Exophiala sideris]KAK5056340.1 hypothetical protein LTR69_007881 [Exophiala sideris]KAK5181171.1 hypothetical protein LTR44_006502 [Eurotiomycetes sp. CCFEE 6388]
MASATSPVTVTFADVDTYISDSLSPESSLPHPLEPDPDTLSRQTSKGSEYARVYTTQFQSLDGQISPREDTRRKVLEQATRIGGAWSVQTVLSLDGGGIRGISTLLIIQALMLQIADVEQNTWPFAQTSGDCEQLSSIEVQQAMSELRDQIPKGKDYMAQSIGNCEFLPCHYFDYIAGTSTGSLIATMLGRMSMSADRTLSEFEELTRKVYGVRYGTLARRVRHLILPAKDSQESKVRNLVTDSFGTKPWRDTDATRCKTFLCSFEQPSRKGSRVPYLFRSYEGDLVVQSMKSKSEAYTVTDVMRATACSPYAFNPVKLGSRKFCDAGLSWTNPTGEVCRELSERWGRGLPPCLMLSIGSGYDQKLQEPPKKRSKPWNYHNIRMQKTTYRVNAALFAISEEVHAYMEDLLECQSNMEYVRLNANLDLYTEDSVHSWQQEVDILQKKITSQTQAYLKQGHVRNSLKHCAETLVDLRRQRSRTTSWEAFAFGVRYRCKEEGCPQKSEQFDWAQMAGHLRKEHLTKDQQYSDDDPRIKPMIMKGRTRSD